MNEKSTVYIVDDDQDVTNSLRWLIESVGYGVETHADARSFLRHYKGQAGCLVLDVRMPELSGLELQEILQQKNMALPIIFVSAHGDVPMAVRAMKRGAIDFLTKPVNNQILLDNINSALRLDIKRREQLTHQEQVHALENKLTPREREVMALMVQGKSTKVIAESLGISPNTVELHRAKVMKKMEVKTVAELVSLTIGADTIVN